MSQRYLIKRELEILDQRRAKVPLIVVILHQCSINSRTLRVDISLSHCSWVIAFWVKGRKKTYSSKFPLFLCFLPAISTVWIELHGGLAAEFRVG